MWNASLSVTAIQTASPRAAIPVVVGALDRHALWSEYASAAAEVLAGSSTWRDGRHVIGDREKDAWLTIVLREHELEVSQVFKGAALQRHRATLLTSWVDALSVMRSELGSAMFGPAVYIGALIDFPRRRPPRHHPMLAANAVVDAVSVSFVAKREPALLAKLEQAPTLSEQRGDLLLLRWVESLALDDAKLGQALAARERWLAEIGIPVKPGWNEAGDSEVVTSSLQPRQDVTFFDPVEGLALKAIYVDDEGVGADDVLAQLGSWQAAHALPDGTPLSLVGVIVPDRRRAIAFSPRARTLGIERVYYTGEDKKLWDPFPSGEWASQD